MTLFGKILVCVNLVFSITLAAVAMGMYSQRINWTSTPAESTPDRAAGELAVRIKAIDRGWKGLQTAEARQQTAATELRRLEQQRWADQQWYAAQLQHMVETASDKDPVKLLVPGPDGKPLPDDKNFGRPTLQPAADRAKLPLRSLKAYTTEKKQTYDQVNDERGKLAKLVEEDSMLTQKLIGGKGLRQRIEDEQEKRFRVELEIRDFVRPNLVNVLVESELLIKRRNQLLERLEELKKAPLVSER
jgi:hypothetical protein